jgi:hypothetical protein
MEQEQIGRQDRGTGKQQGRIALLSAILEMLG